MFIQVLLHNRSQQHLEKNMAQEDMVKNFEKCANYSVLTLLVYNTVNSVKRFQNVPKDELLSKIYSSIKRRAARAKQ